MSVSESPVPLCNVVLRKIRTVDLGEDKRTDFNNPFQWVDTDGALWETRPCCHIPRLCEQGGRIRSLPLKCVWCPNTNSPDLILPEP